MSGTPSRSTRRLEGRPWADELYASLKRRVELHLGKGRPRPRLASVAVGEGGPFQVYQRQQGKMAERAGMEFEAVVLSSTAAQSELEERLDALERDPRVSGVILQHPLPGPLDFRRAIGHLSAAKDVDGVGSENLGLLAAHHPVQVPAVAAAARDLLVRNAIPTRGRPVLVVGRSETVGIPTALLLLQRGEGGDATVTVAHSRSRDLDAVIGRAEVVVSCAGQPDLLHRGNVREGAVVVDVGLSTLPDPSKPSGVRMAGDAKAADLEGWASALSPVPGGVGPLTVAELMANCLKGYELQGGWGSVA